MGGCREYNKIFDIKPNQLSLISLRQTNLMLRILSEKQS
jgi:hypothetical protein